MEKIVSIDDNKDNLLIIESYCNDMGREVISFTNPVEALLYVLTNNIDMIIIDYMMPELDGLQFIKEYRQNNENVPILMITAVNDESIHEKAFIAGTNEFLTKPINSILFKVRVNNLLSLYKKTILLNDKAQLLKNEVLKITEKLIFREKETLSLLGKVAEYKDPETASHIARVAHYSKLLAKGYGLDNEDQDLIFHASPLHDIGKIGIEDKLLLKKDKLNNEEFNIMKTHSLIGYEILKDISSKYLQTGAIISLSHHEKYNGEGYPKGLKKENIHIFGRIVALADVFDALTSTRSYKKAWSFELAVDYLKKEKNKHFDPLLVDIFISNLDQIFTIYKKFQEK